MSDDDTTMGRRDSAGPSFVSSTRNTRVVAAAKLQRRKERERTERFLVEGPNAVDEALDDGIVETIYAVEDHADRYAGRGVEVVVASDEVIAKLATSRSPQGVVAVARREHGSLDDVSGPLVAVLVEVADPGNLGTIIRTADAAGADAVVVAGDACDPWNPKAVRATTGSISHVPIVLADDVASCLSELRARGYRLLGMAADGATDVFALETDDQPVALVFGSEAHGLSPSALALMDAVVAVPLFGKAESLNLSAAAAVALYAAARGRQPPQI